MSINSRINRYFTIKSSFCSQYIEAIFISNTFFDNSINISTIETGKCKQRIVDATVIPVNSLIESALCTAYFDSYDCTLQIAFVSDFQKQRYKYSVCKSQS